MNLTSDFDDIAQDFEKLFFDDIYDDKWILLKSSKNKDAVLHRGYYYNHQRDNAKSYNVNLNPKTSISSLIILKKLG